MKKSKTTRKRTLHKSLAATLTQAIWPQERDFFERPERYKYVRKLLPSSGCVFCQAVKEKPSAENLVLYRDNDVLIIMNKYPYNTGHLLILPKEHVGLLWEIKESVAAKMALWMQRSARILTETLNCAGLNAGLNHGHVAGAGLPDHLHWHIVPRWSGDTNFFPLIAETKVLPETLEQTYNRLKPLFDQEKVK